MEHLTDDELIRQIRNGNHGAFDLVVDRHYSGLFNFLLRMLANREDAEDALHDTFIKAAGALEKYRMEGKFKSWLFTIASNTAISRIRERKRLRLMPGTGGRENPERMAGPADLIADCGPGPAGAAESRELAGILESAVESLPPRQKEVFLMRHASGLSFSEISGALNIPLNTALGRMHYAVKKIREAMGDGI